VTVAGKTYRLEEPFMVLATQNPIEQEGTYPLPEAQLDRFLFEVLVEYPSLEEERKSGRATLVCPARANAACADARGGAEIPQCHRAGAGGA